MEHGFAVARAMTSKPPRKSANHPRDIIKRLAAICLTLLFFVFAEQASAAEQEPSSETVTLKEAVRIPIHVQGKQVGATTVQAGTKVTVVARDGERVSLKHGALEPVWVEGSQVSGLAAKDPNVSKPVKTNTSTTPEKLSGLISGKKWAEAASTCETLAQQDSEKFSSLADLGNQLRSALQAKAAAMAQQTKAEAEAKRLRRNADVAGQPNRLNPSDRSPMERAQKFREQADAVIEEASTALETSEAQIAQLGTEISSELSRLESDAQQKKAEDRASAKAASNDSTKKSGSYHTDTENKKKMELQAAMLVLDWPIKTHTHQEALQDIQQSMSTGILPKLGLTFEDCVKNCPIDPKKTHQENLQIQKTLAIQLGRGWTKSSFRCGDILTVVAFDESATAADVRYSHMKNVLKCSDDGLLNALCSYNEPSAAWVRFEPKGQMNGGIAMGGDPDKPVAVMSAEASEVYLSTPRAQAFWNAKKVSSSTAFILSEEQPTKQAPSTDAQTGDNAAAPNKLSKTPADKKNGQLRVMEALARLSANQSLRSLLKSGSSGSTPQIGMDFQTCVDRFPVGDFDSDAQRDARYGEWVVILDEGWTRAFFRVGDVLADIIFDDAQKAQFIAFSQVEQQPIFARNVIDLEFLRSQIAPEHKWSDFKSRDGGILGCAAFHDQADSIFVDVTRDRAKFLVYTKKGHAFVHKHRDSLDYGE